MPLIVRFTFFHNKIRNCRYQPFPNRSSLPVYSLGNSYTAIRWKSEKLTPRSSTTSFYPRAAHSSIPWITRSCRKSHAHRAFNKPIQPLLVRGPPKSATYRARALNTHNLYYTLTRARGLVCPIARARLEMKIFLLFICGLNKLSSRAAARIRARKFVSRDATRAGGKRFTYIPACARGAIYDFTGRKSSFGPKSRGINHRR